MLAHQILQPAFLCGDCSVDYSKTIIGFFPRNDFFEIIAASESRLHQRPNEYGSRSLIPSTEMLFENRWQNATSHQVRRINHDHWSFANLLLILPFHFVSPVQSNLFLTHLRNQTLSTQERSKRKCQCYANRTYLHQLQTF